MKRTPGTISRRAFLLAAGAAAATAAGIALVPRQAPILQARELGGVPVTYAAGTGKPIVFIGQIHPPEAPGAPELPSNIASVTRAAFAAYDTYGINAILVESLLDDAIATFKREGSFTNQDAASRTYLDGLEALLHGRAWNLYADSAQAYRAAKERLAPVQNAFLASWNQLQTVYAQEGPQAKTPAQLQQFKERFTALRDTLQADLDRLQQAHQARMNEAVFGIRERGAFGVAQTALARENGIVVVYGGKHGSGFQKLAAQDNTAFLHVEDALAREHRERSNDNNMRYTLFTLK